MLAWLVAKIINLSEWEVLPIWYKYFLGKSSTGDL